MPGYLVTIAATDTEEPCSTAVQLGKTAPTLEQLKAAVGGYIEVVPRWNRFLWGGAERDCVAFCNEHGKLNGMKLNLPATVQWWLCLQHHHGFQNCHDQLFGPVAVVIGDYELLKQL